MNVSLIKADTEEGFGVEVTRGRHIHQSPQGLASSVLSSLLWWLSW